MEKATPLRYRLQLDGVDLDDKVIFHPSGGLRRVVEYPAGGRSDKKIRNRLMANGLILGQCLGLSDSRRVVLSVPDASRPVTYDVAVEDVEHQTYGDQQLFFDAGQLLGSLTKIYRSRAINKTTNFGQIFSVTDFGASGDRHLFFTPGIESTINTFGRHHNTRSIYLAQMSSQFGDRFAAQEEHFLNGYEAILDVR